MAYLRIKEMATLSGPVRALDKLPISVNSPDADRCVTFANFFASLGIKSYTVAGLPAPSSSNIFAFATDGRKDGEGAGAGTGILCVFDGADWWTVDNHSNPAA